MDQANEDRATERAIGAVTGGAVLDASDIDELLQKVVLLARHTVGGAHSVSISVPDNGGYRTSNSTADEALLIDEAQYEGDDGPCLRALRSARQVQVRVGANGMRSPEFEERAIAAGVTVVLSTPLIRGDGEPVGALNIYGHRDREFDEPERRTAGIIGEHAAILVENALALESATRLNDQLRHAVASREIIGEAKGIIMERQTCTRDEAFDVLRRASQRENRKLRDVAEELVLRVEARRSESRTEP
ncbi:MAG: GAF and ANTAR domain-containing protein [Actinomycetota bacterium]|nr:GAF and ANTAR domain-containing protein [Actinomycetota bacterium]